MRGYRFYLPWPYDHASAGVRAWYLLADRLNCDGLPTEISTEPFDGERIVVYPDTVSGNPLNASRVVRWLCYFPNFFGPECRYGPDELTFTWLERYGDGLKLQVDTIEPYFTDRRQERTNDSAYYIGKARYRDGGIPSIPDGAVHITKQYPATRLELADLLNTTRTLYTCDPDTALVDEALACGCKVVLLPEWSEITSDSREVPYGDSHHFDALYHRFVATTQSRWA